MMDSFLSIFPKGFFGGLQPTMESSRDDSSSTAELMHLEAESGRKRPRSGGSSTPTLISTRRRSEVPDFELEEDLRPVKRFCGESRKPIDSPVQSKKEAPARSPLSLLPEDALTHCLSFLGSVEDRFSLQCTSKQFGRISNQDEMMIGIAVGGDRSTGVNGILQEDDTPETASDKLTPFAISGNLEAIYMLGIIKSYCSRDVESGIVMLKMASAQGYVRASYALGLVLRDSQSDDAAKYMKDAADAKYLPALQEVLPAREMKAKYGEPNADELRRHLDHLCLSRLLSRHYVRSPDLRELNTSHCWNPLCGRWAFKATVNSSGVAVRMRRPWGFAFYRQGSRPTEVSSPTETNDHSIGPSGSRTPVLDVRVSRMKMCSRCCRAKYCSKLCQVYDWRSGRHKMECQFL